MTHQVFIASYAPDFVWLRHLLNSLRIRSEGFLPPAVVVPENDVAEAQVLVAQTYPGARVGAQDTCPPSASKWGRFLRAQVAMMEADTHCPKADIVWLLGSDCFVHGPLRPAQGMSGTKPVLPITPYAWFTENRLPGPMVWKPSTEFLLQLPLVLFEYMRRLPLLYPRGLFEATRRHIAKAHGVPFREAVYASEKRQLRCSESNLLGAYAHVFAPSTFDWRRVEGGPDLDVEFPVVQFWSHGGLDRPCDPGHRFAGRTPREIIDTLSR